MFDSLYKILDFTLFRIQNAPITMFHLLESLTVIFLGIMVSRLIARRVERKLCALPGMISEHARWMAVKVSVSVCMAVAVYIALYILHVPLTAVHFMAGGLAVGLGFGVKDLLSNLVSGLILIIERPIRIGDVIEFDGEIGKVADIGLRCIRMHPEDNVDILIPNSSLLANKITNWTRVDNMILSFVSIGIAYNSDLQTAEKVMIEAVTKTDGVLKKPAPFIFFKQHGDNALIFHVYFAIIVHNKLDRWSLESRVNHAINHALREAGINIPFPQLDVHIKSTPSGHC